MADYEMRYPYALMKELGGPVNAALYRHIEFRCNLSTRQCTDSRAQLAEFLGMDVGAIDRHLLQLEKLGVINVHRRPRTSHIITIPGREAPKEMKAASATENPYPDLLIDGRDLDDWKALVSAEDTMSQKFDRVAGVTNQLRKETKNYSPDDVRRVLEWLLGREASTSKPLAA